jgi:hypothetical protein
LDSVPAKDDAHTQLCDKRSIKTTVEPANNLLGKEKPKTRRAILLY